MTKMLNSVHRKAAIYELQVPFTVLKTVKPVLSRHRWDPL